MKTVNIWPPDLDPHPHHPPTHHTHTLPPITHPHKHSWGIQQKKKKLYQKAKNNYSDTDIFKITIQCIS